MWGYDNFNFFLTSSGEIIPSGGEKYAKMYKGDNWSTVYWATGSGYACKDKNRRPTFNGYGSGCAAAIIENNWKINY